MKNTIGADEVSINKPQEQEHISAEVRADVAVVLPLLIENTDEDISIRLKYDAISKAVNDYIGRYTIDPRINDIEYILSTPKLPDKEATDTLIGALSGEVDKVVMDNDIINVNNNAITDDKVTLKFELSVEEDVYIEEDTPTLRTQSSQLTGKKPKGELIIQSSEPKLYWQNPETAQLYIKSLPPEVLKSADSINPQTIISTRGTLETTNQVGTGFQSVVDSTTALEQKGGYVKVGNNNRVYTNPHARGNQYYKIVGNFSENSTVKKLGMAGKIASYGSTIVQTGIDYSKAETSQEKGKIVGASIGKVTSGTVAGSVAAGISTAALVSVAGVAGVAAAPITVVVIASCSIIASVAASSFAEKYGEEYGGLVGEQAVEFWKSKTKY